VTQRGFFLLFYPIFEIFGIPKVQAWPDFAPIDP
jgi:hypothetical protein